MRNIFIDVAIAAFVLFIILYLVQIHRLRSGNRRPLGGFRVFINWILLLLIVIGVAGAVYTTVNPSAFGGNTSKQTAKSDDSYQVTNKSTATAGHVSWSPKTIRLNGDDEAKVTFNIPKKTKVRIIGHRSGTVYKVLKSKATAYTKVVKLPDAGKYDVEITMDDGTQTVKHIVVHKRKERSSESSNSSSSSSSSSSRSSSSRASSSSRSNNNNANNNNNNRGNGGSSNTGSSRASANYSGGSRSYNGNSYRPAYRPAYSNNNGASNTSNNAGNNAVYNGRGNAPTGQ